MTVTLPEEYKNKIIAAMSEELGTLYIQLIEELFILNMKWIAYSLLFRVTEERVVLLNENLSGFITEIIQDSMLESVVLSIAYLGDTNSQAFRLGRFVGPLTNNDVDKKIRADLNNLITLARDTSQKLRNDHIAHHNNEIYSSTDKSFKYPMSEKIDEVLDKSQAFINELALFYGLEPFNCGYKNYAGKVSRFFLELSGDLAKDDKYGLKLWNEKRQEWEHLKPTLDRFMPHYVYSLIEEMSDDSKTTA